MEGSISLTPPFDDGFDLLHVSDAASTVRSAVENHKTGIWNVGSGSLVTIHQLAETCARELDGRVILFDGEAARSSRVINWVHDKKARNELDHCCGTPLNKGIAEIAHSLQGANAD